MPKKIYRAICHTKCYWLSNLWKPGDVYEGEYEPNKHFSETGEKPKVEPPAIHGLDPRSTKQLRADLRKFTTSIPRNWGRKEIWAKLMQYERERDLDAATAVDKGPIKKKV